MPNMDPLRLLSRSRKTPKHNIKNGDSHVPSKGQLLRPLLFPNRNETLPSKRIKLTDQHLTDDTNSHLDFFGDAKKEDSSSATRREGSPRKNSDSGPQSIRDGQEHVANEWHPMPVEERKRILKEHRLKVTHLRPPSLPSAKGKNKSKAGQKLDESRSPISPSPLLAFPDLVPRFAVSRKILSNVVEQGFDTPTEVQLGALPLLLDDPTAFIPESELDSHVESNGQRSTIDLLTVAPTGSGKTLAFLIPVLHRIQSDRKVEIMPERKTSALILAPTRELVNQIVNECRKLVHGTGLRVAQIRKGMRIDTPHNEAADGGTTVKADIIVSTPGVLQNILGDGESAHTNASIRHLVLDEADVLLDPLFRDQTLDIWNSLSNSSLRVSMWSATMGSNIEELVTLTIRKRLQRLSGDERSTIHQAPLIRLVVGLKDSAVPNVQHKLIYAASEQGKLMGLRQLLHPSTSSTEAGPTLRPPFLVFTQTIERAIALHGELLYDIPSEAGGIDRIAVLHSDLSDVTRDNVMTRFRNGEVWVLITTDLLSRGVDFLGVNGVVNYDIPTSSAAYVHRIGRTGRAGRTGGVAVTLYSKEDIPYLKHVANVVALAHKQEGDSQGMDQWLLDALPTLSKNEKTTLRKRGIESRTAKAKQNDPRAARKAQISSKSGYDRRLENKRQGPRKAGELKQVSEDDAGNDATSDFDGFD